MIEKENAHHSGTLENQSTVNTTHSSEKSEKSISSSTDSEENDEFVNNIDEAS